MAKRGVRSPDGGDALALTFTRAVSKRGGDESMGGSSLSGPATKAGY